MVVDNEILKFVNKRNDVRNLKYLGQKNKFSLPIRILLVSVLVYCNAPMMCVKSHKNKSWKHNSNRKWDPPLSSSCCCLTITLVSSPMVGVLSVKWIYWWWYPSSCRTGVALYWSHKMKSTKPLVHWATNLLFCLFLLTQDSHWTVLLPPGKCCLSTAWSPPATGRQLQEQTLSTLHHQMHRKWSETSQPTSPKNQQETRNRRSIDLTTIKETEIKEVSKNRLFRWNQRPQWKDKAKKDNKQQLETIEEEDQPNPGKDSSKIISI